MDNSIYEESDIDKDVDLSLNCSIDQSLREKLSINLNDKKNILDIDSNTVIFLLIKEFSFK